MSGRVRAFLLNLSLALASLAVAGVLVEVALRVAGFSNVSFRGPDARLGSHLRPLAEGEFAGEGSAHVRINSAGFRDRERALAKPAGIYRIAVLGDSFVEALQVDLKSTFPALLETRLNGCPALGGGPVEVLSFGVAGYGTAQELLSYRHEASRYAPDLVVLAVYAGNDIRNNSRELEPDKMRPFIVLAGDGLLEDTSFSGSEEFLRRTNSLRGALDALRFLRVVQAAYYVKERLNAHPTPPGARHVDADVFEAGIDNAIYSEPGTPAWRDAWTVTERLLARLNDEVRANGARLVVVVLSSGIQVHPDPEVRRRFVAAAPGRDLFYADRRIEAAARRLNIDSILLAPKLQELAEGGNTFLHGFANTRMGTGHWNQAGHRAAAGLVAEHLCPGAARPAT